MATQERAICTLFLNSLRAEARETGIRLHKQGVRCLRETECLEAFANEWTTAKLAWVERRAEGMTKQPLHQALKQKISEAVSAYEGPGKTQFVDYCLLALSVEKSEIDAGLPRTPGSLFLLGFGERLERIPPKTRLFPRKKLSPHEQIEIMEAVNQRCWTLPESLDCTLESFRSQVTDEIISIS